MVDTGVTATRLTAVTLSCKTGDCLQLLFSQYLLCHYEITAARNEV